MYIYNFIITYIRVSQFISVYANEECKCASFFISLITRPSTRQQK